MGCGRLTQLVLPDTLNSIGSSCFKNCSGIADLELPSSLNKGDYPFDGCSGLKTVTFTNNGNTLNTPSLAFLRTGATDVDVVIESGIEEIPYSAFASCSGIRSILLPNGIKTIQHNAFSGCLALTTVNIPSTVTSVGESAFFNTGFWNAQSDGLVYLDNVLLGYKNTCPMSISIPSGTRLIGDKAVNSSTLVSLTIPNSVTHIGVVQNSCAPRLVSC